MTVRMPPFLLLVPVLLAAPAAAEPAIPYGAPQRVEGTYRTGFESSDFQGCWVTFTEQGRAEFQRLRPAAPANTRRPPGFGSWQVSWLIRRTPETATPPRGQGYGHLGLSKCQIEVQRVFSVATGR